MGSSGLLIVTTQRKKGTPDYIHDQQTLNREYDLASKVHLKSCRIIVSRILMSKEKERIRIHNGPCSLGDAIFMCRETHVSLSLLNRSILGQCSAKNSSFEKSLPHLV